MISEDGNMSALDREALDWLVRLDDQPGDEAVHAAFEAWLESSPAHRASWETALDLASEVETAFPSVMVQDNAPARDGALSNDVIALPLREKRARSRGPRWGLVGGLGLAACLCLAVAPDVALHLRAQEMTGAGEVRSLVLDDGTQVKLAPDSALSFAIDGKTRSARLLRGRAYFDVAHDTARPFRVMAEDAVVTVLGTAFEVDGLSDNASVAVRRGIVAVDYAGHGPRTVLHRGETVSLAAGGQPERGMVRAERVAGWVEGRMFVKDRPVGEVLDALRPWYGGCMIVRGPGLATRRVTGIYDLRDPNAALSALGKAHSIRVRAITPWLKIVTVQ
ncbi:FecR family protein [Novosphingobium sp. TCA1]|uniref:FecR family protein n=1 Tax=Novosphingobium sp. TCA1 TaxID=2682474 RepID=UPI001309530B|nr:FecR family protein [Novosphingobium sp. TCA1]GFE72993.1 iron dicitrate transporter FecR [Novosphingobium sp. TCA1]